MTSTDTHTGTYSVAGMTCDHCVASVTEELQELEGVTGVRVELTSGEVTVWSRDKLDSHSVRAAVEEAGYRLTE